MTKKLSEILFSLFIIFSLPLISFASVSSLSQVGSSDTFDLVSDVQHTFALFRTDNGTLVDGGTLNASQQFVLSWYSVNSFSFAGVFFKVDCSPAWYSYNRDTALASSCAVGYFTGDKSGSSVSNFSGFIALNNEPDPVIGCMDASANNYNPDATEDSDPSSCLYGSDPVIGCMDASANNYNPDATEDSDPTSCTYDIPDPESSLSLDLVDVFLGFLALAGFNGLLFGVLLVLFKRDSLV